MDVTEVLEEMLDEIRELRREIDGYENDSAVQQARALLIMAKNALEEAKQYLEEWEVENVARHGS